jgi:glucose-6-phosphate isomerase
MLPFQLNLTPESFRNHPGARTILRRLSEIGDIFSNAAEVQRLAAYDPLIYEFIDLRDGLAGGMMSFGLTTIHPGAVGGEYYMTKGHFHAAHQDGDEVYLGVSGKGLLLLQSRQGESRTLDLLPGAILYTPLAWAHRTVNVGSEPLVFFSIWPSATAYDYEEITHRGGFPQRVMDQNGLPALVPNPDFQETFR